MGAVKKSLRELRNKGKRQQETFLTEVGNKPGQGALVETPEGQVIDVSKPISGGKLTDEARRGSDLSKVLSQVEARSSILDMPDLDEDSRERRRKLAQRSARRRGRASTILTQETLG